MPGEHLVIIIWTRPLVRDDGSMAPPVPEKPWFAWPFAGHLILLYLTSGIHQ